MVSADYIAKINQCARNSTINVTRLLNEVDELSERKTERVNVSCELGVVRCQL
jgi:predicted DNA-binding ribbon-helix-helix protein